MIKIDGKYYKSIPSTDCAGCAFSAIDEDKVCKGGYVKDDDGGIHFCGYVIFEELVGSDEILICQELEKMKRLLGS